MRAIAYVLVGVAVLAQDEQPGLVRSGDYREADEPALLQLDLPEPAAEDVYAVGPYLTRASDLPPGEGLETVEGYCQICHGTSYITMQPPLPPESWDAEIDKMIETHGASIPEEAAEEIRSYLKARFTPPTRER